MSLPTDSGKVSDLSTYHSLFEQAPDALLIIQNKQVVDCNQATVELLGYDHKSEVLNLHPAELSPKFQPDGELSRTKAEENMAIVFEKGSHEFEWIHKRKGGEEFLVQVILKRFMLGDEPLIQVIWHDITKQREAEDAVLHYQAQLEQANLELEAKVLARTAELNASNEELSTALEHLKSTQSQLVEREKLASLGEMVAGISHEINTPLGICITAASLIENELETLNQNLTANAMTRSSLTSFYDQVVEANSLLTNNMKRAASLVKSFKKISVNQSDDQLQEFKLNELLNDAIAATRPKTKLVKAQFRLQGDSDIHCTSFPGSLTIVLINLIVNSVVHGFVDRDVCTITITTEQIQKQGDDYVRLVYQDNGAGIEPDIVKRIFDPFVTTKRGSESTGLGMSISYNLVTQQLHGSLTLSSTLDHGAIFTIEMPQHLSEDSEDASAG